MNIFQGEFYKMADELARDLDSLAERYPTLLLSRWFFVRTNSTFRSWLEMGSTVAESFVQGLEPGIKRIYGSLQRAELEGRVRDRLWFLPMGLARLVSRIWPRKYLPLLPEIDSEVCDASR